jgi:four helix bundle protein
LFASYSISGRGTGSHSAQSPPVVSDKTKAPGVGQKKTDTEGYEKDAFDIRSFGSSPNQSTLRSPPSAVACYGGWIAAMEDGWEKVAKDSRVQGVRGSSEMLKNYKELNVWQKSYKLCLHIYKVTKRFPKDEMYGLTSQIRRSAVSIPSNIAEGYGRKTTLEYVRFLYIAYGSVCELETQTMISGDLGYVGKERLQELREEIGDVERMLKAMIKSLENKHLNP